MKQYTVICPNCSFEAVVTDDDIGKEPYDCAACHEYYTIHRLDDGALIAVSGRTGLPHKDLVEDWSG